MKRQSQRDRDRDSYREIYTEGRRNIDEKTETARYRPNMRDIGGKKYPEKQRQKDINKE